MFSRLLCMVSKERNKDGFTEVFFFVLFYSHCNKQLQWCSYSEQPWTSEIIIQLNEPTSELQQFIHSCQTVTVWLSRPGARSCTRTTWYIHWCTYSADAKFTRVSPINFHPYFVNSMCWGYHNKLIGVRDSHTMANTNETPELEDPPASIKSVVWKQSGSQSAKTETERERELWKGWCVCVALPLCNT